MICDADCKTHGFTPAKSTSNPATTAAAKVRATAIGDHAAGIEGQSSKIEGHYSRTDDHHSGTKGHSSENAASSYHHYSAGFLQVVSTFKVHGHSCETASHLTCKGRCSPGPSGASRSSLQVASSRTVVPSCHLVKVFRLWKPVRNILQSWRLSVASLMFFTLFITDNFGLSTCSHLENSQVGGSQRSTRSVPPPHDHPSPHIDFHNNNRHRHQQQQSSSSSSLSYGPYSSSGSSRSSSTSTFWSLSEYFYKNIVNISLPSKSGPGAEGDPPSEQSSTCLVSYNISRDICDKSPVIHRKRIMRRLSLVFCGSGYPLYHLVGDSCKITGTTQECRACFDPIEQLDKNVHSMFCHFEEILSKTDCLTNYSTHWNCNDCKVSYPLCFFVI